MAESVYKVIDSSAPARNPGRRLSPGLLPRRPGSRRDLRIVEVGQTRSSDRGRTSQDLPRQGQGVIWVTESAL